MQSVAAHVLDLLGDVRPVHLGFVDQLAGGAAAQQLAWRSDQTKMSVS
jgi:hypothetical protein